MKKRFDTAAQELNSGSLSSLATTIQLYLIRVHLYCKVLILDHVVLLEHMYLVVLGTVLEIKLT